MTKRAEMPDRGGAVDRHGVPALSVIGGEFRDPALERAFLAETWPSIRRHVVCGALIAGAVFLAIGLLDLARHGSSDAFLLMMAARLTVFACAIVPAVLALRPVRDPRVGPAMVLLYWVMFGGMIAIAEMRGHIGLTYIAGLMALVVAHYLFVPARMTVVTLSSVLLSSLGIAYAAARGTAPVIDLDGLAAILIASNLLGASLVFTLNRVRRHDYAMLLARKEWAETLRTEVERLEGRLRAATTERDGLARAVAALSAREAALPDGVLAVDGAGRVTAWNAAFTALWRIEAPDLAGLPTTKLRQRLKGLLDPASPDDLLPPTDGDTAAVDLILRDGRVLEQSVRRLALPDGPPGRVWTFRDVTPRVRALEAQKAAAVQAEAAARARSAFLAMVSHELRTPLNGILGMNRLLAESRLTTGQRAWVEASSHSGEVMLAVLDDLLEYNRLETAELELLREPFDLRDTVQGVARLFSPRAAEKGLSLAVAIAPEAPARLVGDANRLRQILMNLVGNAVKFTHAGSVGIAVSVPTPAPAVGTRLLFAVTDTGIGMSPGTLDRIFDPFVQGDPAVARAYGGTGLGLAICRRLVELQDGEIGAESRLAEGSRFWFTIAYGVAEDEERPAQQPSAPARTAAPMRVLLADDNAVNQRLVTTILEARGHKVTAVEDGALAVAAARLGGYDLLILDVRMPALGGIEAAALIRSLPGPEGRVPIVALTAGGHPEEQAACRAAGIDAVVVKPFAVETLLAALAGAAAAAETV